MHQEIELIITLASGHTRSNRNLRFEDNKLKEAEVIVCLAADASRQFPDAQLVCFTPDTYLLVWPLHTITNSANGHLPLCYQVRLM